MTYNLLKKKKSCSSIYGCVNDEEPDCHSDKVIIRSNSMVAENKIKYNEIKENSEGSNRVGLSIVQLMTAHLGILKLNPIRERGDLTAVYSKLNEVVEEGKEDLIP